MPEDFPQNLPDAGQLVRHTDGGIYRFVAPARHTEDLSPLVIYQHVWPFEAGAVWARPAGEWLSRFTPMTRSDADSLMVGDRLDAQQAVTAAKAARRANEGR